MSIFVASEQTLEVITVLIRNSYITYFHIFNFASLKFTLSCLDMTVPNFIT